MLQVRYTPRRYCSTHRRRLSRKGEKPIVTTGQSFCRKLRGKPCAAQGSTVKSRLRTRTVRRSGGGGRPRVSRGSVSGGRPPVSDGCLSSSDGGRVEGDGSGEARWTMPALRECWREMVVDLEAEEKASATGEVCTSLEVYTSPVALAFSAASRSTAIPLRHSRSADITRLASPLSSPSALPLSLRRPSNTGGLPPDTYHRLT